MRTRKEDKKGTWKRVIKKIDGYATAEESDTGRLAYMGVATSREEGSGQEECRETRRAFVPDYALYRFLKSVFNPDRHIRLNEIRTSLMHALQRLN
jgi:hypothetical protein